MIDWPKNSDIPQLIAAIRGELAINPTMLEIDVPQNTYLDPWAVSVMAAWGRELIQNGTSISFNGDKNQLNYLARLNLFRSLGIDYRENFWRHPEQGRFIPVSTVTDVESVQSVIRKICEMVLRQIENSSTFVPAMEWITNEIVDNIVIHSGTKTSGNVCAQYYPGRNLIIIGIVDRGIGIRTSLSQSYSTLDDISAIRKSIQRGITRSRDYGMGNGLAGSVQIVGLNQGDLKILSGNAIYHQDGKMEQAPRILSEHFGGTAIRIELKTDHPVDLMNTFMAEQALEWTFLDYEAQRLLEAGGIIIKSECLHTRGRETARPLRNKVENLLNSFDGPIIFDFNDITSPSSSFMDELFGRLVVKLGPDEFKRRFKVKNMNETLKALANTAIRDRIRLGEQ